MTDTKIKTSPCALSPPKILLVMDQNNELQLSRSDQPTSQHPTSPWLYASLAAAAPSTKRRFVEKRAHTHASLTFQVHA